VSEFFGGQAHQLVAAGADDSIVKCRALKCGMAPLPDDCIFFYMLVNVLAALLKPPMPG
jgi:hypothetical protein